jgi:hypothetical protein
MSGAPSYPLWCVSRRGSDFVQVRVSINDQASRAVLLLADIVAKVENRTTQKISRKSISGLLCCCIACQRLCGDPRSILDETIWSLTSPRVRRISGSKNFRSPPQKDFCNNIGTNAKCGPRRAMSEFEKNGRHLLGLSISHFDPTRTSALIPSQLVCGCCAIGT